MATMTPIRRSDPDPIARAYGDAEAAEMVAAVTWYHRYELRPGLLTPGSSDMPAAASLDALGIPANLAGKRALDVGAWDGPLTFELERRGAAAFALDIQDPTRVGFDVARRILGSRAVHYQGSVYQLPHDLLSDLDLVIFRGVFYHLKHPLLAFECLSQAIRLGGRLYFEGESFLQYAETLSGTSLEDNALTRLALSDVPICLCYPGRYKGAPNWSVPNPACLKGWLEASGFEVEAMVNVTGSGGAQRIYGSAVKRSDGGPRLEHPLY